MNFRNELSKFTTCEIHSKTGVNCFAKLSSGNWVAVKDGSLDWVEIDPVDFESLLETVVSTTGAVVRFTNHSAI